MRGRVLQFLDPITVFGQDLARFPVDQDRPDRRFTPFGGKAGLFQRPDHIWVASFLHGGRSVRCAPPGNKDAETGKHNPRSDCAKRRRQGNAEMDNQQDTDGQRIAKVMARAGLCSRREAERWIAEGRVTIDGETITTPAVTVTAENQVTVDGKPLPTADRVRLWRYHKPAGLLTTSNDPHGRPTVFDDLPRDLPRLISVGRLDLNSEGLLLFTNDGELARKLEHPLTGLPRKYRIRVYGVVDPAKLESIDRGVTVDGVKYGPIYAELERQQTSNAWITVILREGKNREVRRVMEHLGYRVNRLIRTGYGMIALGDMPRSAIEEVPAGVVKKLLGERHKGAKAKPKPVKPGYKRTAAAKARGRKSADADRRGKT